MPIENEKGIKEEEGKIRAFSVILYLLAALMGCQDNITYQQNRSLENGKWFEKNVLNFQFEVSDLQKDYQLYYTFENGLDFPNYNFYLSFYLEDAQGNILKQQLQQVLFFNSKTGTPTGKPNFGSNRFTNEILALEKIKFSVKGKYTLKLKQYMRVDPVPEIWSVGVKLLKKE
jgi:gliding motility-associated lipoprotein GldH